MNRGKQLAVGRWVLLAGVLGLSLAGPGLGADCKQRRLERGKLVEASASGEHTCWCGILIQTEHRTCSTLWIYVPDRYLCDGPASEVIDCVAGGVVYVEERTMQCTQVQLGVSVKVAGMGISVNLPVYVGTECRTVSTRVVDHLLTANEVPCRPMERNPTETPRVARDAPEKSE